MVSASPWNIFPVVSGIHRGRYANGSSRFHLPLLVSANLTTFQWQENTPFPSKRWMHWAVGPVNDRTPVYASYLCLDTVKSCALFLTVLNEQSFPQSLIFSDDQFITKSPWTPSTYKRRSTLSTNTESRQSLPPPWAKTGDRTPSRTRMVALRYKWGLLWDEVLFPVRSVD